MKTLYRCDVFMWITFSDVLSILSLIVGILSLIVGVRSIILTKKISKKTDKNLVSKNLEETLFASPYTKVLICTLQW